MIAPDLFLKTLDRIRVALRLLIFDLHQQNPRIAGYGDVVTKPGNVFIASAANATDSEGFSIFAPTSVQMTERSISYDGETGKATLTWEAAGESQMIGFHIYRQFDGTSVQASSTGTNAGEWIRLTD